MDKKTSDIAGTEGHDVAAGFLAAIKNEDALSFWRLLDKRGQGYFMGMWFLALADADIRTIEGLAGESTFLTNALRPILDNLKSSLGALLDCASFGPILYLDGEHAAVPLLHPDGKQIQDGQEHGENIPLVLELAPSSHQNSALTCWKVDTFKCIQFGKHA